jgi:hypothetical protein
MGRIGIMKKILVALIAVGLVGVPMMASAKLGKIKRTKFAKKGGWTIGAHLIGGPAMMDTGLLKFNNINNNDIKDDKFKQSSFGIAPSVGYFVIDNLEIELGFGYGSEGMEDASTSTWSLTPTVRYYLPIKQLQKKGMNVSLALGFTYGSQTSPCSLGSVQQAQEAAMTGDADMAAGDAAAAAAAAGDAAAGDAAAGDAAAGDAAANAAPAASGSSAKSCRDEQSDSFTAFTLGLGLTQALGAKQGAFIRVGLDYNLITVDQEFSDDDLDMRGFNVGVKFGAFLY